MFNCNRVIRCYQDAYDIRTEIAPFQTRGWHLFYRGHANESFKLLPTIGRKKPLFGDMTKCEQAYFHEYKQLVKIEEWERYKPSSLNDDLFLMSIGRHLGLDCRLLDWSASLDTALFFAAGDEANSDCDGTLWIMVYKGTIDLGNAKTDPFSFTDFSIIKESHLWLNDVVSSQPLGLSRRLRQNGFFTITPTENVTTPLNEQNIQNTFFFPIKIKAEAKSDIIKKVPRDEDWLLLNRPSRIADDIKVINSKYFIST